jgi:RNA polymerase sigma-70 factor (ECF subfamily)
VSAAFPQPGTFEELAMPLFGQIYNFAHWLAQDRDEAEDLVQETYLKAFKAFGSFQPGTNFRAWIYRILRNTFLNTRSGKKLAKTISLDDEESGAVAAATTDAQTRESILIDRNHQDLVTSALEELPLHFREVLLLCEVEEMSYQEIADTIAVPVGTVMSRLSRARAALRANLQQKLPRT